MDQEKNSSSLTLPGAIIIAATIIGIAIIWTRQPSSARPVSSQDRTAEITMAPLSAADHVLGNPEAPVKIVEYSDASCPFCKTFHPTMRKIIEEYGPSGKVAWVYRHFPLDKPGEDGKILHPNAGHEAQAMECAGALGGNEKFWAFTNRLFEITPSVTTQTPNGLDQKELLTIAQYVGVNAVSFNECLSSGRFKEKVEGQYLDGLNAGVSGTPYSIVITPSGSKIPLVGLQSYTTLKNVIETLLGGTGA